jgi:hypothetical protein
MSAGFKVADNVFWGTNGAVEAYVEALADRAAAQFGAEDPLAVFFHDERQAFYMGHIVFLDDWLKDDASRGRFLEVLDAATTKLLREGTFSPYGQEWVATIIAELRANVWSRLTVGQGIFPWNNSTVVALAHAIHDKRTFDQLPILADALEDAGCTNADILNHCRQPGIHDAACWVVDLLVGSLS